MNNKPERPKMIVYEVGKIKSVKEAKRVEVRKISRKRYRHLDNKDSKNSIR
ncbi:MAG: hypothetical protein ACOCRK_04940 [bacterium]